MAISELKVLLAVILLDELEKAHKVCQFILEKFHLSHCHQDVAMILLQILDEGTITDSQACKVDFKVGVIKRSCLWLPS